MWKAVLSYTSSHVLLMHWALSLLLICLMHHVLVGLTRKHLILAALSLGHCAVWSRREQTLVFGICCDEWLLFAPATDQGPRLSADTAAGGQTHTWVQGSSVRPQTVMAEEWGPPLSLAWSFIFAPTVVALMRGFPSIQSPGLSIRGWRFCNSLWFSVQEYLTCERKISVGVKSREARG